MRTIIAPAFIAILLSGCAVELLTTTAIQGELQSGQMKAMKRQIQGAASTSGKINLQKAIGHYSGEHGTYPPSLDALVPNYLPAVPLKTDGTSYGYDATTGRIFEEGTLAIDTKTIQDINSAINQYGTQVGYYPPTLDVLYPQFLASPPRRSQGQQFVYNNQNGYVGLPGGTSGQQNSPQRSAASQGYGGGGGGPMGEVMTGIAIQNEMNSQSHAGVNRVGSVGRGSIQNISGTHNDRQNQVMDDLGL
jgi:hypothetical protein